MNFSFWGRGTGPTQIAGRSWPPHNTWLTGHPCVYEYLDGERPTKIFRWDSHPRYRPSCSIPDTSQIAVETKIAAPRTVQCYRAKEKMALQRVAAKRLFAE